MVGNPDLQRTAEDPNWVRRRRTCHSTRWPRNGMLGCRVVAQGSAAVCQVSWSLRGSEMALLRGRPGLYELLSTPARSTAAAVASRVGSSCTSDTLPELNDAWTEYATLSRRYGSIRLGARKLTGVSIAAGEICNRGGRGGRGRTQGGTDTK